MAGGRPLKFPTPEALWEQAETYFEECKANGTPLTITGIAIALDTSRETLCDYQERDQFSDTILKIKMRAEHFAEKQLYEGKNAAGPVFALKNYGWKDQQDVNHSGSLQLTGLGALLSEQDGDTKGV